MKKIQKETFQNLTFFHFKCQRFVVTKKSFVNFVESAFFVWEMIFTFVKVKIYIFISAIGESNLKEI